MLAEQVSVHEHTGDKAELREVERDNGDGGKRERSQESTTRVSMLERDGREENLEIKMVCKKSIMCLRHCHRSTRRFRHANYILG